MGLIIQSPCFLSRRQKLSSVVLLKTRLHLSWLFCSRKSSRADVLTPPGDEHICAPSQSELSVFQHCCPTLPHSESPQRSNTSTQSEPVSVFITSRQTCRSTHVSVCVLQPPARTMSFSHINLLYGERRVSAEMRQKSPTTRLKTVRKTTSTAVWSNKMCGNSSL